MSDAPKMQTREQMLMGLAQAGPTDDKPLPMTEREQAAWAAGWAAGREAAALTASAMATCEDKGCRVHDAKDGGVPYSWLEAWQTMDEHAADIADAIRALPVPQPPATDGEAG